MDTLPDESQLDLTALLNVTEIRKISLKPDENGEINTKRLAEFDERKLKNLEECRRMQEYSSRDTGDLVDDYGQDEQRDSTSSYITLRATRVHSIQSSSHPHHADSFHSNDIGSGGSMVDAESSDGADRAQFHQYICWITHSKIFSRFIMIIILLNSVVIVLDLEIKNKSEFLVQFLPTLNNGCLAIYTLEFAMKLYSDRWQYWYSSYNVFDFLILLLAYIDLAIELSQLQHDTKILKLVRSMRTFRALRSISFIQGVQVIANALISTLKQLVVDVILLLMLMMFVFGIMGYYFFGYDAKTEAVYDNWGNLSNSFLSLFTLVTMDRWTKFIDALTEEEVSLYYSRTYIIIYLFVGHFIISNLFIAVIITNIESSSNNFKMMLLKERDIIVQEKKKEFWYRCKREVKWMMDKAHLDGSCNFQDLATEFYFSLQKRDFVVMSDLKTNLIWLDTLSKELSRYHHNSRRILSTHRDAVSALAPVCSIAVVDERKSSITTSPRFNVQHKIGALALLKQPIKEYNASKNVKSRRLSLAGEKRKPFLKPYPSTILSSAAHNKPEGMSDDNTDQPARASRRPQRKKSLISSYEQLARDEEKQLQRALKASMIDAPDKYVSDTESEPESEPEKPVKRGRGRPRGTSKRQKPAPKSSPSPSPSPAPSPKSAASSNPALESPKSTSKKKKSIIRQKSVSGDPVRAQRKFASVHSNGKRGGLVRQRSGGPKVEPQKPVIASPAKEEKAKTEDFIDYLCLRKNVRAKAEWKSFSGEEEDDLIIAESEDSSVDDIAGEDFSIFEFDDAPTEPTKHTNKPKPTDTLATLTVKNKSKSKKSELTKDTKKRRITQNYYNANLKCTDHTDNSALPTAPVFRPTGEEFKNFHAYLEKITPHLLTSGICKIIPPVTWRPPPVLQEDMRFGVNYQEVHRLCHRFGPSTQVLAQIKSHLANQGVEWKTTPQIGSVVIDLARFSWLMRKNGGLQVVIDKYKWQKIGDALGVPDVAERNVQLEEIYCKYLLGYDLLSDSDKEKLASDEHDNSNNVEMQGKQMTLSALRRHDAHARKTRFAPDGVASASSLEHDFWMLLTSAEQHFVAPNGSESTRTHGSGFPANKPRHIAESDWNLTNLPSLPDGVMGFLPGVASVTQPRLEFCSLYTSSGWHVEPHFLPQISYNHFNHPRIWYATPASDSRKILSVLHDIAPRLIPGNHLLDRNSVMVPPAEISSRGISVCRAVQKPGEFIITAPKAYLSNLSLGLNVNEVVNFATEEWLHHCSDSVSLYQSWSIKPLLNIAQIIIDVIEHHDSLNESSLRLAEPFLTSLLNEELTARKTCTLPTGAHSDKDELYCGTCQTLCHLSHVRVEKAGVKKEGNEEKKKKKEKKNSTIFCLKHARHLKSGTLECRISEDKVKSLLSVLEKRLYPKRSIVHPVQSLPRSVRRTHLTPSPVTVVSRRSQSPSGSPPVPSSPNSPTCPPSPAEEECTRGLTLVIPPQPISCALPASPIYSPKPVRSLARPVPLKPQPIKSPGIPSLAVRPQQNYLHSLLPQQHPTAALWERWYPGMQQQFP